MEILFFAAILGLITGAIAQSKGRSFVGWWFFGWMLFIVALPCVLLVSNQSGKKCPACTEFVPLEATICKHCRTALN